MINVENIKCFKNHKLVHKDYDNHIIYHCLMCLRPNERISKFRIRFTNNEISGYSFYIIKNNIEYYCVSLLDSKIFNNSLNHNYSLFKINNKKIYNLKSIFIDLDFNSEKFNEDYVLNKFDRLKMFV